MQLGTTTHAPALHEAHRIVEVIVEKWAYFFREAASLDVVPPPLLTEPALVDAFEPARLASFTMAEWDDYGVAAPAGDANLSCPPRP